MVSEKVVVILIVVAILLSIVSIVVTISTVNSSLIPKLNPSVTNIPDQESSQVGITIIQTPEPAT